MEQLFSELLHAALVLFITFFGLYCLLFAVQAVRVHPARMLGRMVRGILEAVFWLVKTLVGASVELLSGIVVGLPSPKTASSHPAYGTGSFLEGRLLLSAGRKHNGLVIDGNKKRLTAEASYMHCAVIAGSGKGKTTRYTIPNVLALSHVHSLVSFDPSGEIRASCGGSLASQSVRTMVVSVADVSHSLKFNPVHLASTPGELRQIASSLITTAYSDKRGSNSMWEDGAMSFLSLLLRCLKNEDDPAVRHLPSLKKLVDSFEFDGKPLNSFIARNADENTMAEWKSLISEPEKIRLGKVATARVAMEPFSAPDICKLMSKNTVDFTALRTERSCLFIQIPEHRITFFRFFLVLLYSALFDFAMINPKPHEQSIFFLLDEFGNAGVIPLFSNYLTSLRKRKVSVSILLQSESQLHKTYGRDSAEIILSGGIASRLYLPGQDMATCIALEKTLGKHGITTLDESGRRRDVSRNLLNADEIRTMPDDQALFIHSNQRPALIRTTPYFKNRRLRKRTRIPPPPLPTSDNGPVPYLTL